MSTAMIVGAGGTLGQKSDSVARVTFWYIPDRMDLRAATVIECFFNDRSAAEAFTAAHAARPEVALLELLGPTPINPRTFSFRAEWRGDTIAFRQLLAQRGHAFSFKEMPHLLQVRTGKPIDVGEPKVEIQADLTLEQMRDLMREIPDSHIMLESMRELPLDKNPLSRDPSIN